MNKLLKEFLIIITCLILGFAISKYILTNIRGSEYNSISLESKQNENRTSK
jgi:hypothetical protein